MVHEHRLRYHEVASLGLPDNLPVPAARPKHVTYLDSVALAQRLVNDYFALAGGITALDHLNRPPQPRRWIEADEVNVHLLAHSFFRGRQLNDANALHAANDHGAPGLDGLIAVQVALSPHGVISLRRQ